MCSLSHTKTSSLFPSQNTMKSKFQAHARINNHSRSTFTTKVHINSNGKCGSAGEFETSASLCLREEEFSRQLRELKTMYEDLIGFAEAMLEQSNNWLRQIQRNNFSQSVEKSCEDLVAAISDHRETLVRDLRFVETKIMPRGSVVSVSNRVQHEEIV